LVEYIEADPAQLEQIVMNLALNARDAMPDGGNLRIETKQVEVDDSNVWLHPNVRPGSYALLSFTDSGPGNARAHRPEVFELLSNTGAPRSGTGLGLATVHAIVEQSAGFMRVCREPGAGASVNVFLPRVQSEGGPDREPGEQNEAMNRRPSGIGSETILLVEDDQTVRALARLVLCDRGYRVIEAEDGLEGVRLCRQVQGSIDLIVTDVVMPNASGPQMAEALHSLHPRIKFLYMSGHNENRLVMRTIESGAPFLRKPFSATDLACMVREVLDS
jgi:CheY-like chemotaxis protein